MTRPVGTTPASDAVSRALLVQGPSPQYHRDQLARLRRDWPVLADALVGLLRERGERVPRELIR